MKNNQGQPLCLNLIRSKWSKSAYLLYKNVGDCKRAIRITMRLWFNNYKPEVRRIVRRKEFSSINIDRDQVPIFYSELIVSLVLQNIQQIQQNMVPWQFFYRILGRIIPRCLHKCTVNAQKSITAEHNKKENYLLPIFTKRSYFGCISFLLLEGRACFNNIVPPTQHDSIE